MIRICQIGISGFGGVHYNEIIDHQTQGLSTYVAATIINQDEEIERCAYLRSIGCELYTDFNAMFKDWGSKADVCIVPTGIHWHAPMAIAAMEAGLHVLLEKPAAATVADINAMQAVEKRTGKRVMMGFQSMYAIETLAMKRLILSGRLGTINDIVSWSLWPRNPDYYARNAWAGRLHVNGTPVLDSPFNNAVAHQLHMILFLAGSEETTSAEIARVRAELYRAKPIESCDSAAIEAITTTGLSCRFLTSHTTVERVDPVIEVRGSLGTLRWDFHRSLTLTLPDGRSEAFDVDINNNCRERMHTAIRESVGGGNAFTCDLRHAKAHTTVVNLAHAVGPIHTIDAQHYDANHNVTGMADAIVACAAKPGTLLNDVGTPWSKPGVTRAAEPMPTVSELIGTP